MKTNRIKQIKELLMEQGEVNTSKLCENFGVSSVTIRNDLIALEREGFALRTYGGARCRAAEPTAPDPLAGDGSPFLHVSNLAKKKRIVQEAAKIVQDDTWIYLSSGTTCYELAKLLVNRSINVVTGSLLTAQLLSYSSKTNVFIPGGSLKRREQGDISLAGEWYTHSISNISVDLCFLTIAGVDMAAGITINDTSELSLVHKLREIGKKVYLLVDSSKFDQRSFMSAGGLDYADGVITNRDIPQKYADYFHEHGIELITC